MKKFIGHVAAMMAVCVFATSLTGCIDNDEPAGIENLRDAKASLLKSKEALVAAQAQRELAEAEAVKVKAAAEALYYEALAAKTDAERAKIQQEMNDAALAAAQALADAKLAYDRALTAWELEKLNLSDEEVKSLNVWYDKYFKALEEYNEKYLAYVTAQAQYVKNALDPSGSAFNAKQNLEKAITTANNDLAEAQDKLKGLTDTLALAKAWTPSELGAKWQTYNEQLTADKKKAAEIAVQLEERKSQSAEGKALVAAQDAQEKVVEKEVAIPAYTFNPADQVSIPGITEPKEIIAPKMTYTWADQTNYDNAEYLLQNWVEEIKSYILDDNDREWTKARINELKKEEAAATERTNEVAAAWQMFVKAYNVGAAVDYTALESATVIADAVKAYNDAVPNVQKAKDAYYAAVEAAEKADAAAGISTAPQEKYDAAMEAAAAAREAAVKAADAAREAAVKALADKVFAAEQALAAAQRKQAQADALAAANPEDQALAAAAEAAKNAADAAQAAYDAALTALTEGQTAANDKYAQAVAAAQTAYDNAAFDAKSTYDREQRAAIEAATKANAAAVAAHDAANTAKTAYDEAFAALVNLIIGNDTEAASISAAVEAQIEAIGAMTVYNVNEGQSNVDAFAAEVYTARFDEKTALPICKVENVSPYTSLNLKNNIIASSNELYGFYSAEIRDDANRYPELNIPNAQLVPLTKADVDAVLAHYGIDQVDYPSYYDNFGLFGQQIGIAARIEVATAYLNNKNIVSEAVAGAQTQLDNLTKGHEALEAEVNAANEAVETAQAAFDTANEALLSQQKANDREIGVLTDLIALIDSFKPAAGSDDYNTWSQDTLDDFIAALETEIKNLEKDIEDKTTAIAKAEYLLDQYEKGLVSADEIAKITVERAKLAMDLAKEKCDVAKAQLDAAIKRFEGSAN